MKLVTLIVGLSFATASVAYEGTFRFEFNAGAYSLTNDNLATNVLVRIRLELDDPEGKAAAAARAIEKGTTNLSLLEHSGAIFWNLSQYQFVRAEQLARQVVRSSGGTNREALFGLAVAQTCRGDYEAAYATLERTNVFDLPQTLGFRLCLKASVLGNADEVAPRIRRLIETGEINQPGLVVTAALNACLHAKEGEPLFKALVKKLDRRLLFPDSYNSLHYLVLCRRYGMEDEARAFEAMNRELSGITR